MPGSQALNSPIQLDVIVAGGLIFAVKMRSKNYVTMLDPFQEKYGARIGALMYIPLFIGDILWCASILAALGASIGVVLDIDNTLAIIVSACFCVAYTFVGGLYSVAYTDIVQIFFIFVGLVSDFYMCPFNRKKYLTIDTYIYLVAINTICVHQPCRT